jgi:hypothetical protein
MIIFLPKKITISIIKHISLLLSVVLFGIENYKAY